MEQMFDNGRLVGYVVRQVPVGEISPHRTRTVVVIASTLSLTAVLGLSMRDATAKKKSHARPGLQAACHPKPTARD